MLVRTNWDLETYRNKLENLILSIKIMFCIPFVLLKMAVIFLITNLTFGNTFVGQMAEKGVRTIAAVTSHFITEIVK